MNECPASLLKEEGYAKIEAFQARDLMVDWVKTIRLRLHQCAQELSCTYQDYLQVASRWVSPSPITEGLEELVDCIKTFLEELMEEGCELIKLNIISKTPFSPETLPFHQDIAYSPEFPYQFSAWLALTDAPLESGPMEVIASSHKGTIEPAMDFWDPEFKDEIPLKKKGSRKLPVKAGDLILFDSRLWHGSGKNESYYERFALVTRWKTKRYIPPFIPSIKPCPFGMWTCQKETEKILTNGLWALFQEAPGAYREVLKKWETLLENTTFPFLEDSKKAQESIRRIFLLNEAHHAHNGGDAQGVLYARLWQHLLSPLSLHLCQLGKN